jgi:uncharacterized protein YceH (UPF0502 family)
VDSTEQLNPVEARVIGALIEKAATTPDNYPLSTNALLAACNQSTNRDPVMELTEREIDAVMMELRQRGLARTLAGAGHRVPKHRHIVDEAMHLDPTELGVVAVLLLRGPQTLKEIATRSERYSDGAAGDSEAINAAIDRLTARPDALVTRLARKSGEREPRIDELWSGGEPTPTAPDPASPVAAPAPQPVNRAVASERRVALITPVGDYVGPDIARTLARQGHDLVLGKGTPPALADELEDLGALVVVVDDLGPEDQASAYQPLVDAALDEFGRLDAATMVSGRIITGSFLGRATADDLAALSRGLLHAPFEFLKAVSAPMVAQGHGQILVFTSASGSRPTPNAPLYSSLRAGANHLVRNVAAELAPHGVQCNAAGTNYMDFPAFWGAVGGETAERRAAIESQVPMKSMGNVAEMAALACAYLDGSATFMTGQLVNFDGGWSVA